MLKERADAMSPCTGIGVGGVGGGAECAGCGARIFDRFYLLAVDRQWHATCLRCCECRAPLDTELTCFSRDANIYCKDDYYRLYGVRRCARCQAGIPASELVMRARDLVFHVHCFTCAACNAPLAKGDHFGMRDALVYCRPHYELLDQLCSPLHVHHVEQHQQHRRRLVDAFGPLMLDGSIGSASSTAKGRPRKRKQASDSSAPTEHHLRTVAMRMSTAGALGNQSPHELRVAVVARESRDSCVWTVSCFYSTEMLQVPSDLSSSMESLAYDAGVSSPGSACGAGSSGGGSGGAGGPQQRTKRMRTSFKHHQLRTMKSYFAINQNPDAKDLKQLAQKTGLSKRVLQVWFQNARAKWRRNLMRQEGGAAPGTSPGTLLDGGAAVATSHHHDEQHVLRTAMSSSQYDDIY